MSIAARASRMGRASLAALLALAALPIVLAFPSGIALAGPPPVFTMFVPFSEQQVSDGLFSIYGTGGTPADVVTTIDITSAADGSIMYWDHWEDGYEADIANPVQPTSQIWGDGNPANGAPPGVPSDLVDAGTIIFLQNNVALPRNPATVLFDGRDKVASTRGFAMSRAGWDSALGTIHAGAVAATDLSKYGTQFTMPVGENIGFSAFNYSGVSVMASDDNTTVEFDINGDGTVDQTSVLAEGETAFIDGGVNAGGTISATKPIQVHMITGERNSNYEGRWYEIFPEEIRGDEYVAAAGSTSNAERVTVFLQNPGAGSITVAVDAEGTANDTNLVIAPGAVAAYDLPNGSGARFSSPGNPFIAVSGTVAVTGNTTWYDWGYSLVPTSSLTPGVVVGWGAGNPDGTQNHSPVWVAPLADTTLYVDIDGDGIADQTIANVLAYESVRIVDTTDNDMTGARIYTLDGTLISAAWGQDPAGGECCNAYDLGTAVLPSTALVTTKTAEIVVDVNGDGNLNPGDTLEYTIHSVDAGALSLTNIVVQDQLPSTLTYVANTTVVDGVPIADDTVGTPFPVDGAGVVIPVLAPGAVADVTFRAQLVDPFPLFTQSVRNTVLATADQGSATATSILPVVIPNLYVAKSSSAAGPLMPGQIFDYVIDVSNIDVGPQSGIDVTDTLPPELTWLSTSVARPIDDPAPGGADVLDDTFSPAQYGNNPTEWVGNWVETDSAGGGATGGNVRIVSELGSNRVRLRGGNSAITRSFDGAAWDEATLTYDYRPDSLEGSDWVSFQISTTGGTSWIELDRVVGPLTNAAYSTLNYDLTRYLGQDVALRWVTSPGFSGSADSFFVDNVAVAVNKRVIEVVPGGAPPALYTGGELLTGESLTVTVTVQLDPAVDPTTDSITNVASAVSTQNTSPVLSGATDPIARASVGDTVWHDQDGDGIVDVGEPRLAGVTVTLYDAGGTPIGTDITDASGNYEFTDLDPVSYTVAVTGGVPAGMITTFDADGGYDESTAVSLGFGEVDTTTDFGYAVPVALGDRVFSDLGGDGVENGGDFGIDGLTVTITGPSHPGGTTTTTSAGTYGFANLLPGTYTVDVDTSPLSTAAYSTTGGDSQVVVLTSGNDDLTVDFGYVLPAAIGDTVFHDLDADGIQDPGEPPFVGVDVTITGTGLPVGGLTTTTDASGTYLFSDLDAGDFTITVTEGTGNLPVGYDASTPGGLVQTRSVLADEIVFDVDFGFYTQATIGDFVFEDVNGNGAWDVGEPGIDGVPITITGPSFPGGTTVTTAGGGLYDVTVDPGTYTVVPDTSGFPLGTVNSHDGAGPAVTVASTEDVNSADFGYVFPSSVGDFVFHDLDDSGGWDAGEPGLDGVDLTITGGTLPPGGLTTTTAAGGAYLFSNLDPGVYTVTVDTATVPVGYVSSTGGDSIAAIIVVSATNRADIDFGYRGTADIGDLVYHDLDADGVWDAGEPGLPGVEVTLSGPGVAPGTTDVTDAGGNYLFAALDPGTYSVTVNTATVPAGYTVTAGTDSRTITLLSDTDVLTADLGYATTASIGDFVWNDLDGDGIFDPGEPGFDGVTVTLDDGVTPITQDTVNGAFDFTGVAPGTYTVTVDAADLPAGVVNTLGGVSRTVTVVSEQDENGADFAYYVPAAIGDLVWDDLDGDGVLDAGEPGLPAVTVTLTGGALPPGGITDVTDAAGAYDFPGLAPGTYTVTLTATDLPAGAVNTVGGTSQVVIVQSGDVDDTIDFGFYVPAAIGDLVWDDLDGDGVFDVGEPAIAGVTVTLTGPGVPPGTTDVTDAAGVYGFPGLAPGTYTVTVDTAGLAPGAASTTGGFAASTTIVSGTDDLGVDFGVADPITIGDNVFDDLDGDGVQDPGEPGLAGVDVTITGPSHPGGSTVPTDAFGNYQFASLLPGSYTVVVDVLDVPAGYGNSSPTTVTATYQSGAAVDTVDFGFTAPADLGDLVFEDLDADGTLDPGEPGLAGVTLELSGPGVAPGTTVTTTATGAYAFANLDPGTYTVTVTAVPPGYTNTVGGASQVTTLTSGESEVTLDFGYYFGASIGDFVWDDLDGDGLFDAGEPGFDAVTVTLDDGVTAVTQDTINGAYDFVGLTPGTYTVSVDTADLPAGAVNTAGGASQTFTVASGDDEDGGDFAYYVPGSIGDYLWDDLNGDGLQNDGPASTVGIGGVTITITGPSHPGGTTVVTNADGSYGLGVLAPGSYTVAVDTAGLPAGSTSTTGGFATTTVITSGATVTDVDFGVAVPAAVGDLVFMDNNGNTVFDAGDAPLPGVQLTLTGPGIAPGTTDVTDAAGAYGFAGLLPGTYTVTVDGPLPPGAFSTTGGDSTVVTLSSGETDDGIDFGYAQPAAIGDVLFHDLDNDGVQDLGEPGLANVDITLTGPGQPVGGTTIPTGPGGAYSFTGLAPGTYTVTVDTADPDMDPTFVSTTGGDAVVRTLASAEVVTDVDFGYTAPGSIGDLVFTDANGDGDPAGDGGLGGVTLTLTGGSLPPGGISTTTDGAGAYSFPGVLPGSYTVTVTGGLPAGAFPTTAGGLAQPVTITSGETDSTIDFGFAQPATIGDFVFEDQDGDAIVDPGEPGFPAVDVTITGPSHPGGLTVPTDGSGGFSFGGLAPGTYTITVDTADLPPGAINTLGGPSRTITVSSNDTILTADFGYAVPASIGDLVFEDLDGDGTVDVGEPGYDAVDVTITGPSHPGGLTVPTVNGAYDFTGLVAGTYTITVDTAGLPAGVVNTLGGISRTVVLASGEDHDAADFGYYEPATIGDYVWDDLDGDGVQDDGPAATVGIAGVDVTITGPTHPGGFTVTTDAAGGYDFTGLAPGTYTIAAPLAGPIAGGTATTGPTTRTVTVTSGGDENGVDFGVAFPAALGDTVFDDVNGNGIQEAGDNGFPTVDVTIVGPSFPGGSTVTTDGSGNYGFAGLFPGSYTITVDTADLPAGALSTTGGDAQTIVVSSGETDLDADFGYALPATIGDQLFVDNNGNGVFDAGDTGIVGVDVTITGPGHPTGTTVTTGATGTYGLTGLEPGSFTVVVDTTDPDFDPTWSSTSGGDSQIVAVGSGSVVDTVDFGYAAPATIGDTVFDDLNGDGTQQPGEPGIAGITVTLTGGDLGGPVNATTDGSGNYSFGGLTPGDYVVTTAVAGSASTTGGDSRNVSVASGQVDDGVDFGYAAAAALGDTVFHDLDGDGSQGGGEPGLAGVTVTLTGPGIAPGTTSTTDGSGNYGFAGLAPGTYTVTVDTAGLPSPAHASTTGGDAQVVVLSSGETDNGVDFGYAAPASIGDLVWDDLDGDGTVDPGEPGFDAVTVTLDDGVAPVSQDTVNGAYDFTGLAPGTYTVTVDTADLPAGAVNTLGGASQVVTVQSAETVDAVDFGYYQPGSIGDLVFVDDNGNGTFNIGEAGLDGVEVTLTGAALGAPLVTTTAAGGGYTFSGLAPGSYTATLTGGVPAGATSTTGGNAQTVTIASGDDRLDVDFGLAENVTVGDLVWHDLDGDGTVDAGEPGLAGVTLELRDVSDTTIATATSDGAGAYSFTGVAPGMYTVVVDTATVPGGYTPSTAETFPITVTSGNDITNIDVGYATTGSIGDLVWDDLDGDGVFDAGEPGLDGLTVTLTGGGLGAPLTTVTAGGGAFVFAGLDPGTYTATVSPPAGGNSTTGGDAQTVTIASNEDRLDVDFGYALAATIGDRLWHDLDGDGIQDGGEPGLAGIEVTLAGPSGPASATTDGVGIYVFAGLLPGTYTVAYNPATVPVGSVSGVQLAPTTPASISVPIQSGDDVVTADIGFATTGTIDGSIYEDDDADGTMAPGESGLPAVTVELVDGGGTVVATATTDANGDFSFTGVAPGSYSVRVDESTVPGGFIRTSPAVIFVTIGSDEALTGVDVGYARPATIGDLVWHDLDADGTFDAGEPGLGGVTLELVNGGGSVVATAVTDGAGAYAFTGVDPATYTVRVDLGSLPVGANSGVAFVASAGVPSSAPVTVQSGETVDTADFAFHTTATIGDLVWHDLDANSTPDAGEPGMTVTVELLDAIGTVVASATTAADGSFSISGIAPGTYDVRVVGEPAGYSSTTGNDPSTIVLVSDQLDDGVDFGFALLTGGSIGNEVWDDLDGDGVRDAGEPGIGGVTVELLLGGTTIDTRVTTSAGAYLFANLAPGSYEIQVDPGTLPAGYAATTPGGDAQTSTILSGEADLAVDFGYAAPATVGDVVWHDLDGDGVQDAGEPGISGVVVELLDGAGTVIDTATTDASGAYTLSAALAGDYSVTVVPASTPSGANSGSPMVPTTPTTFAVTLSSNEVRTDLDVGFVTTASIGDTIFDDLDGDGALDAGEPGLAGVTVVLTDAGGGTTTAVTGADGSYAFAGLAPGAYSVGVDTPSLPAGAVATTTAAPVPVSVVSDDLVDSVDLGFALPASLAGMVFVDAAGDGTHVGDSGMGGVTVELLDATGVVIATTTTLADGSYVFTGLLPGSGTVRPVLPAGYGFTVPDTGDDTVDSDVLVPSGETAPIWIASGANLVDVDAGIVAPATIGDTVWVDLDGDGIHDAGEPGLAGAVVEIRTAGGALVATATTDASGGYGFSVDPGLYTVSIVVPGGYYVPAGGDQTTVSVMSGDSELDADFGLLGAGGISGDIAYDVSGDGTIDPGDPGHDGVTITAIWDGPDGTPGTADDVTFSAVTSAGTYSFTDLPPGDYTVTVDPASLPDGLIDPTLDPDGVIDLTTTLPVGAPVAGVDFATTGTASLGDNVFVDENENGVLDAGEPGVGGVVVTATVTTTSGVRSFTTVTDATGFYQFDDLPAGDYVVTLDATTVPVGLVPSIPTRSATLVINGTDDSLDLALVRRTGPVAGDDEDETPLNTPVVVTVLDNDTMPTGTSVSITAVTQPAQGSVVINGDGTVTYTPGPDFAGTVVFTYTICDLAALAALGDNPATRAVFCSTSSVTITTPPADPVPPGSQTTDPGPTTTTTTTTTTAPSPSAATTPTQLPRTGGSSRPIQTMALVFLAAGLALLAAGRRRTQPQR